MQTSTQSFTAREETHMEGHKTVRINNRLYDAATGMPLDEAPAASAPVAAPVEKSTPKPTPAPKPVVKHETKPVEKPTVAPKPKVAASEVHSAQQRSKTLHRRATKKPGPVPRPQAGRHMDIARSTKVSRFAPTIHPISTPEPADEAPLAAHQPHPTVKRALARVAQPMPVIAATPRQIKDAAIEAALAPTPKAEKQRKNFDPTKLNKLFSKRVGIIALIVAALLTVGGIVYANLPTISVGVAASQAGISATYPKYIPDGYSLSQPVTFKEGEVALTFTSNTGLGEYKVTQTDSTWNSTAVLDNVVRKEAGDDYVTNQERGLTIYSYDGNAAWVNAGILYTIDSSAPLSSDQIRRIAVSLS